MRSLKRVLKAVACALTALLLVVAGIGLSFWLRGPTASWPGPKVVDALPLGELPHFDRIPLIVFVLVWIVIALALGALVRRAPRASHRRGAADARCRVGAVPHRRPVAVSRAAALGALRAGRSGQGASRL